MDHVRASLPPGGSLSYESLQHLLTRRPKDSHKGDFGHVLVIGGDAGFGGASLMAAEAASRVGAGLVSVATHPTHISSYLSHRPELMCTGIEHESQLEPLLAKASVIVLGPGLGQSDWATSLFTVVMQVQSQSEKPLLLDADALNLFSLGVCADLTSTLKMLVLTPHVGEAARLLKTGKEDIVADREQAAIELQALCRGVAVLKGAGTLVCYEDAAGLRLDRCDLGNPGMASGGMGDVLSGVIGGLLAQHYSLSDAARLGVCIHAHSADKSAKLDGERGMLATDLMPWLRRLVNPR